MLHHSFEHMDDPEEQLKVYFEKLKSGGKLLIRCTVTDGEVWKSKGPLWVQLDAPRHLVIPSLTGIKNLAEKAGFLLKEVAFDSTDIQFWGTKLYENGEKLDKNKIELYFNRAERKNMLKKATQYNREGKGDQACFYFVKMEPS